MRKKRFHWYLLLVFLLTVGIVAGCSDSDTTESVEEETNDSETNDEAGEEDDVFVLGEEPLEISMFGNYDWYTMPGWGDDVATAWIKENKKVDITAIDGGGNAEQKLPTMIAGDELPDFIWTDRGAAVERLREGGALVPLDPYLDNYTSLRDWFGEEGINMLRSDDGKLYQFPNWYNSSPFGNAGYVINNQ